MAAMGYAIALLLCGASEGCETTALRAARFQNLGQCQAALPQALAAAARVRPDISTLTTRCLSLAELCPATVDGAQFSAGRLQLADSHLIMRSSPSIAVVLALLCAPQAADD